LRYFAGIPFCNLNLHEAANHIAESVSREEAAAYLLVNSYSIASSTRIKRYQILLQTSSLNLADGFPIRLLTRFSREPINQVRGADLFREVLLESQKRGLANFFLGSTDVVLEQLIARIQKLYPGIKIAGKFAPSFHTPSSEDLVLQDDLVSASGADLVWVALGTPKQDLEARRIADSTGKTVIAVGAAFDFVAGIKPESPVFLQRIGAEWLFRLAIEPGRLWKRYLWGNLVFIFEAVRPRRKS
jgi:N-acetylglucosaminyldiphosphoundecaprenol N-acetyl-beta-D-mannosaminyltransferase